MLIKTYLNHLHYPKHQLSKCLTHIMKASRAESPKR